MRSGGERPPRVGLALSSGGARGLAHIGVLEVLQQHGVPVHAVSGSSMGAYIGAHLAAGHSPAEMYETALRVADRKALWELADPIVPPVKGFFKGGKAANFLRDCLGDPCFSELQIPFYAVSFDLDTREKLVMRQGNVAQAVHASCAIPGIVAPVMVDGHRCSDGGVVDPVPVSVLREYADVDVIIAVNLVPTLHDIQAGHTRPHSEPDLPLRSRLMRGFNRSTNLFAPGNTVDTLRKSIAAAQCQIAHASCADADLAIHPSVYGLHWHRFDALPEIVAAGRTAAEAVLPALQQLMARRYPLPIVTTLNS